MFKKKKMAAEIARLRYRSECGEEHAWDEYRATYCEDCGAKMDEEVTHER